MTARSRSWEPHAEKANLPKDIEERIRQRAYELYEQRGRVHGLALDDWLQAEQEIRLSKKHGGKGKRVKGQ